MSASDAALCFWHGKTIIYFHSGNQQGVAGLEMAEFDGPPEELLADLDNLQTVQQQRLGRDASPHP